MGGQGLLAKFAYDVVEAVGGGVHIGIIDLIGITGENNLRPMADARDDGFDFQRGEVLRLVDDHKLMGDAAPANVAQGLDHDGAGAHQVVAAAMLVAHV